MVGAMVVPATRSSAAPAWTLRLALAPLAASLFLSSSSALQHQLVVPPEPEWSESGAGAGVWSQLGNFTPLELLDIQDPIPALHGCAGFDCVTRYCAFQDGAFSWGVSGAPQRGQTSGANWTLYSLSLSSQAWMANSTRKAAWQHTLTVIVPEALQAGSPQAGWATLIVEGASSDQLRTAEELAVRTGAVAATVNSVPNVGLSFYASGKYDLPEEPLKAWTWAQYAKHKDHPEWPVEMPSVKAVVRAMDALVAFADQAGSLAAIPKVERFIVTGESKRGMATYMAGAVDARVKAIVPLVISLDMPGFMEGVVQDLGGFDPAAYPYLMEGTMGIVGEDLERVTSIIDPMTYAAHLAMPKLLINAGMDVFFPPDVTRSWLRSLPGPTTFYLCGNATHGSYGPRNDFLSAADAFINAQILGQEVPVITWSFRTNGAISVQQQSDHVPTSVRLMVARSPDGKKRDFRKSPWLASNISALPGSNGRTWLAKVEPEAGRWTAFYVEFQYQGPRPGGAPWHISTEVSVVPDTRPFAGANYHDPQYWRLALKQLSGVRRWRP